MRGWLTVRERGARAAAAASVVTSASAGRGAWPRSAHPIPKPIAVHATSADAIGLPRRRARFI